MKEIKFRAWDKTRKKMKYFKTINDLHLYFMDDANLSKIGLMQYIGLEKNGKEIYESDICLWDDCVGNKVVIAWGIEECCWCYYFIGDKIFPTNTSRIYPLMICTKELRVYYDHECDIIIENHIEKVLGNIYENPELIKEKVTGK